MSVSTNMKYDVHNNHTHSIQPFKSVNQSAALSVSQQAASESEVHTCKLAFSAVP